MKKKALIQLSKHIILLFLSLMILIPIYMVVVNAFKTKIDASKMGLGLPTQWMFSNFLEVIDKGRLVQGFANSLLYALVSTGCGVTLCAMASFVISRNRTRLNRFIYYFFVTGLFFPVNFVTLVRVFKFLHLTNTKTGIVLVFTSAMIPFCIFTIYSFVESVPKEMDEAALIDGASALQMFFRVIFPMLKPTLVTCFILQFMGVWNDFMTPLYLSSSSSLFPITMSVYQFFGRNNSYWNLIFADIVVTIIPVVIVYFIGQRYLVEGTNSGAVKG